MNRYSVHFIILSTIILFHTVNRQLADVSSLRPGAPVLQVPYMKTTQKEASANTEDSRFDRLSFVS